MLNNIIFRPFVSTLYCVTRDVFSRRKRRAMEYIRGTFLWALFDVPTYNNGVKKS